MKKQKNDPSSHLCEAILESDEKGIKVINELERNNLLNANVVNKLAIDTDYFDGEEDKGFGNSLHVAAWKGRENCLKRLLAVKNVDPNLKDADYDYIPLRLAVDFCGSSSSFECVKILTENENTNINALNRYGDNILIDAIDAVSVYSTPESIECLKYFLSHPKIDFNFRHRFGHTAFECVLDESCSKAKKIILKWIIDGLKGRRNFTRLIIPNLDGLLDYFRKKQRKKLSEAIKYAKKLEKLTCDGAWDWFKDGIMNNYSIIAFVDKETDEDWVLEIMERNRQARTNCFEASVQTFLIFKQKLNKDMGNLFASWVWETRGTKIWSF